MLSVESVEENKLYRVMASGGQWSCYARASSCALSPRRVPTPMDPLDEGTLTGDVVEYPWHGSRYRLCDGRVLTGPATVNAPRYDVRIRNGQVEVKRESRSVFNSHEGKARGGTWTPQMRTRL